ncbi:MAG: hypothetical protein AAB738_01555 [Patescibacteria group bacterium]
MSVQAIKTKSNIDRKQSELLVKAEILDELVELIEDKYLGFLMRSTEKEKNISLKKVRPLLR